MSEHEPNESTPPPAPPLAPPSMASAPPPPPLEPERLSPPPDGEVPAPPSPPVEHSHFGSGQRPWALIGLVLVMLFGGLLVVFVRPKPRPPIHTELVATIADLAPVHASVTVGSDQVRERRRLAKDDVIETSADGRARLRLDDGTSVILDGATKLVLTGDGVRLEAGRVFVTTGPAKSTIDLGAGSVSAVGSTLGIERRERTRVYVANGEVTARTTSKEAVVRTGESADFTKGLDVAPERGFDDWTGGLAAPWANSGSKRALAELWGRGQPGHVGSPLTIRTQDVRATIHGEVAETRVMTTFFNAGEQTVLGDYRMGLPAGAIVSAFSVARGADRRNGVIALAKRGEIARFEQAAQGGGGDTLEWAGEGWVRGTLPNIAPGQSVTVAVTYVEWLPVRDGAVGGAKGAKHVVQYRFPLAGDAAPPLVGEFHIAVDAGPAGATQVAAGMGAEVSGNTVELRKSDFRASADFVVDMEIPAPLSKARGYVAEAGNDEATFVVRTEAPRLDGSNEEGLTLAVVLDTSASIDPALLDAGRAFVEALAKSLGDRDRIVILASDTSARPVGPAKATKADATTKEAIVAALGNVTRGGATDLGRALEAAADAIPNDAPSGMVVYVGDGWGSVGDRTAEAIRARLARRATGVPRVGAVLVGPSSNRRTFAELTRGSGPLVEIGDSEDAARASVELLENAIVPTVTGITVDLGPDVSRIYPRQEIAAPQGSSVLIVGKLAADPPKAIKVTYRAGGKTITEERPLAVFEAPHPGDVKRRWADARAQAMALAGRGRESVTDAALGVSLLTPWTAWTTLPSGGAGGEYLSSPLSTRVLELGGGGTGFDVEVAGSEAPALSLAAPEDALIEASTSTLEDALFLAAVRTIQDAKGQLKACRDSRAALRPDLPGAVQITFKLDGDGKTSDVAVQNAGDATLATCITTIVANLPYPHVAADVKVNVSHTVVWPPIETLRGKKCSPTSQLAVPLRRGVWRERIDQSGPSSAYLEARRGCELASWTAKRSFLELALTVLGERGSMSIAALGLAKELEDWGDAEAAGFLRKEALRRANPMELRQVRRILLASERLPYGEYAARYEKATTNEQRLQVVKTFLGLAPHDPRLRGRLIALLAALKQNEALIDEARRLRSDPYVDATLIADAAHLLRTIGLEDEARRTYGEIAERATHDPWAHALLGDRLRHEGWFDDATAVYQALEDLVPLDAATQIRLALAHIGATRLDVGLRILDRVARTGGRTAEPELAELADRAAHALVRTTLARTDIPADDRKRLESELAEMTALPVGTAFLVEAPAGFDPVNVHIERGPDAARELVRPRALASKLGLVSLHLEPSDPSAAGKVFLSLARRKTFEPSEPYKVRIYAIEAGKLTTTEVELPASGERIEVDFSSGTFGAPRLEAAKPPAKPLR
ncbi:MAG: VWA domain-containing protein [Polyangiaceae bacterium]|nr:VWA domain-containing protein [Polyangiaceae bacterium]